MDLTTADDGYKQLLLNRAAGLKARGLWRELGLAPGVDFSSNDYLGLAENPNIRQKMIAALQAGIPLGAGGSRLLRGNRQEHEEAETELTQRYGRPCLLLGSGYCANMAVLGSLAALEPKLTFFSDELNHASLIDGIRLTKAPCEIFRHNDMNELEGKLRSSARSSAAAKVIVTESVFSMDGDQAPLNELVSLASHYNSYLVIDEAHATGVFGTHGQGLVSDDLWRSGVPMLTIHTCGKALGGHGAFVVCERSMRDWLINSARQFIFSTALPPLGARQILWAFDELKSQPKCQPKNQPKNQPELANACLNNSLFLLECLWSHFGENAALDLQVEIPAQFSSQILPIILGSNERAIAAAQFLQSHGFDVRAVRSPTVAKGRERLRLSVKSWHCQKQLSELAQRLHQHCLSVKAN